MAVTTLGVISAASAAYSAVDSADKQRKAVNQANDAAKAAAAGTGGGAVNTAALQQQAQEIALQNAANSAALEAKYNPGAGALRAGSLEALMAALNAPQGGRDNLAARIAAQAGQPLASQGFDSALTRQAVEAASRDLALGGELPLDVRNLVTQRALERSGNITGRLDLGRDLSVRDLGLTSLDLYNRRLANAASLGAQEAGLEQANAAMRAQSEQYGRGNLLQSAEFLDSIASGDFAKALAAAQFGQNIAQPMSGLDPGSVVNLAVGNSNLAANAQQQANALAAQTANNRSAMSSQLLGTGLGFLQNYLNKPKTTPVTTYSYGGAFGGPSTVGGFTGNYP